jgi:hypothetical protein
LETGGGGFIIVCGVVVDAEVGGIGAWVVDEEFERADGVTDLGACVVKGFEFMNGVTELGAAGGEVIVCGTVFVAWDFAASASAFA